MLGTACGEGGFNLEVGKWRVFVAYHGMQDDIVMPILYESTLTTINGKFF